MKAKSQTAVIMLHLRAIGIIVNTSFLVRNGPYKASLRPLIVRISACYVLFWPLEVPVVLMSTCACNQCHCFHMWLIRGCVFKLTASFVSLLGYFCS